MSVTPTVTAQLLLAPDATPFRPTVLPPAKAMMVLLRRSQTAIAGERYEVMVTVAVSTVQTFRHGGKTKILQTHISKSEMWGTRP